MKVIVRCLSIPTKERKNDFIEKKNGKQICLFTIIQINKVSE